MRLRPSIPILTVLLLALAATHANAARAPRTREPVERAAIRESIARSNDRHLEALRSGNDSLFASRFTADGALLFVSGKTIQGAAHLAQFFASQVQELGTLAEGEIVTRDVFLLDSIAYETGRYSWTFTRDGATTATLAGRYVAAWRRGRDGAWKVLRWIEVPRE